MVGPPERRKFIAAEHADQGKIAQYLLDVRGVDAGDAIERTAAGTTIKVKTKSRRFTVQARSLALEHFLQIVSRALAIAQGKDHRLPLADLVGHRDDAFIGVQSDNISYQILSRGDVVVVAVRRQTDEQDRQRAPQIFRQRSLEQFGKD